MANDWYIYLMCVYANLRSFYFEEVDERHIYSKVCENKEVFYLILGVKYFIYLTLFI